jgi:glucose/arabinose dehydrogenase
MRFSPLMRAVRRAMAVPALPAVASLAVAVGSCSEAPTAPQQNRPPSVRIAGPDSTLLFAGGDTLSIRVVATDPDQGALPSGAVSWWAVLHHDEHTHPFQPVTAGAAGSLGIPRTGHDEASIFIRIYARAEDAGGLADTVSVDIFPQLTTLVLQSVPSGLQVALDGQPRTTPYSEQTVVGMQRTVGAIDPLEVGGARYSFLQWADGGDMERTLITPVAALTLTARYDSAGPANSAPSVVLTSPVNGASFLEGASIPLTATVVDEEGDAVVVSYLVDDTVRAVISTAPYTASITASVGRHRIVALAEDARGALRRTEPIEVTVLAADGRDVLAPVVALVSPSAGTRDLAGAVTVEATATDEVGVVEVQFAVDDSVFATVQSAPFEATLSNTAGFASGAHSFAVRARDAAGNWSAWARSSVTFGGTVALEAGFSRSVVASGVGTTLTAMAFAPDGRLFVTVQSGALRVLKNGVLLAEPFVTVPTIADGERGLLGIALDPEFASTGWVYLYYTSSATGEARNRIVRYTANGDVAAEGSGVLLVELPGLGDVAKHNGGAMHFGPDGKLYVAVGDATTPTNAQLLNNPFGKILRFNRNGSIPTDNPFYAQTTGVNRAIWARGLRNPFTMSIDGSTGRLHINDVGQMTWEEINLGRPGANYGWPTTEGPTSVAGQDAPLLAIAHENSPTLFESTAVIGGGFVSVGSGNFGARFAGDYFFADYVYGWIYRLDSGAEWRPAAFAQLNAGGTFNPVNAITGLSMGPDGALYVLIGSRIERIGH